MKKRFVCLIALMLSLVIGAGQAASYTLPEKMYNQLAIGSGLKGSFSITAEGEAFDTPFLKVITDAEFSLRGMSSGEDLHYYLFQQDGEQQSGVTELYRREGTYYLRSDMVPDRILAFPDAARYLDSLFPSGKENTPASPFIYKIMTLPEDIRKEKWEPVLTRYGNELEMWLADFTVLAETVRMENGVSALDFTYEIPMSRVAEKIIALAGEIAADGEALELLDSVMSKEEKDLYINGNLLYYYAEALGNIDQSRCVRLNRRMSVMGEVLSSRLELPLDERSTGYTLLEIKQIGELTVYTLRKTGQVTVLALPDTEAFGKPEYEQSVWFAKADTEAQENNLAVRIDISRTVETHDDAEDRNHETDHYSLHIEHDSTYIPEDTDPALIPEYTATDIEIDLHYSSKYAQNSATVLEVGAEMKKGESVLKVEGKFKTAVPWLFMPFEIANPTDTGTGTGEVLLPYLTDWISNAASIIRHSDTQNSAEEEHAEESSADQAGETAGNENDQEANPDAESAPLEEAGDE